MLTIPGLVRLTTDAGIYQDGAPLRTQKVTAVVIAPGVRAAKKLWVALAKGGPGLGRDTGKELAQREGEISLTIGQG